MWRRNEDRAFSAPIGRAKGALKALARGGVAVALLGLVFLFNHNSIRVLPIWGESDYSPMVLSFCVISIAFFVVFWRNEKSGGRLAFALRLIWRIVFLAYASLAALVSSANLVVVVRSSDMPSGRVISVGDGIAIVGKIDRRTVIRVEELLDAGARRYVSASSLGGENAAALRLAQVLNQRRVIMRVEKVCASACLLAWASVAHREASEGAMFGIHASHDGNGDRGGELVSRALSYQDREMSLALINAGFPKGRVSEAMSKPTEVVTWVAGNEMEAMGVRAIYIQ